MLNVTINASVDKQKKSIRIKAPDVITTVIIIVIYKFTRNDIADV